MNVNKIRRILILVVLVGAAGNFVYQMWLREKPVSPPTPQQKSSETSPPDPSKVTGWADFEDSMMGYRMKRPEIWSLTDHTGEDGLVRADIVDGTLGGIQVRAQRAGGELLQAFADAYLEAYRNQMSRRWKAEVGVITGGVRQMGDLEVYRAAMIQNRPGGRNWFLKLFIWVREDSAVILQCGTLSAWIHHFEPLFDKAAMSFEFVD